MSVSSSMIVSSCFFVCAAQTLQRRRQAPLGVAGGTGQAALLGPAAVAVHDDGDVPRQPVRVQPGGGDPFACRGVKRRGHSHPRVVSHGQEQALPG